MLSTAGGAGFRSPSTSTIAYRTGKEADDVVRYELIGDRRPQSRNAKSAQVIVEVTVSRVQRDRLDAVTASRSQRTAVACSPASSASRAT